MLTDVDVKEATSRRGRGPAPITLAGTERASICQVDIQMDISHTESGITATPTHAGQPLLLAVDFRFRGNDVWEGDPACVTSAPKALPSSRTWYNSVRLAKLAQNHAKSVLRHAWGEPAQFFGHPDGFARGQVDAGVAGVTIDEQFAIT